MDSTNDLRPLSPRRDAGTEVRGCALHGRVRLFGRRIAHFLTKGLRSQCYTVACTDRTNTNFTISSGGRLVLDGSAVTLMRGLAAKAVLVIVQLGEIRNNPEETPSGPDWGLNNSLGEPLATSEVSSGGWGPGLRSPGL